MDDIPGGTKWAIRKTNVQGQAALSPSERAAADGGQMTPEMIGHIAGAIEDAGPDATLNDALTGRSGTVIVNRLISEGFFSEQERPALMDGKTGALTQVAKDRIGKALLGRFFRNSDQISRTPASIRNKLERIAAPVSKVAGDPDWDVTPDIREAIDLIEFAQAHGIRNLGDVVSQSSMFGEAPKWSDGAVKLAELLRDGKPNDAVAAFRRYVNSKEPTMFGESTPNQAFADAFGAEKPARAGPAEQAVLRESGGDTKRRYTLLVHRGSEPIGEYTFNATPEGLRQLHERIKPELRYEILSRDGVIFRSPDQAAAAGISPADGSPKTGPHGPIYREYSGKPAEAIAKLMREQKGEVPRVWYHPVLGWIDLIWGNKAGELAHIIAKHVEGQKDLNLDDFAEMIPGMRVEENDGHTATLENERHEAAMRLDYDGNTKQWLVTAYEKKPPAEGYPVVSGSPQSAPQGDGHPPSDGSSSSVTGTTEKPGGTGPTYMGSGFGALEPLFREAKAEGDRLRSALRHPYDGAGASAERAARGEFGGGPDGNGKGLPEEERAVTSLWFSPFTAPAAFTGFPYAPRPA